MAGEIRECGECRQESQGDVFADRLWSERPVLWGYEVKEEEGGEESS